MNRLLCILAASLAILVGCNSPTAPTFAAPRAPTPTPTPVSSTGSFLGNIMDGDTHRECIENASAEIIAGPLAGTIYPQDVEHCTDPAGIIITGPEGSLIRLRASAPGYTSVERDFIIARRGISHDINLKRAE